jgi:hypothetical protein
MLSSDSSLFFLLISVSFFFFLGLGYFSRNTLVVLYAGFVLVERYDGIVCSTHTIAACCATKDWAFYTGIVDLTR